MATCVCVLQAEGNSGVNGSLKLSQNTEDGPTSIEGQIRGLTPGQKHGIAVCVFGDLSDGGNSCGPSFNPFGTFQGEEKKIFVDICFAGSFSFPPSDSSLFFVLVSFMNCRKNTWSSVR